MTTPSLDLALEQPRFHIMIDLETLGRKPGCAILSIGAVKFDLNDPDTPIDELDKYHVAISPDSGAGLVCDPETVAWWLHPDRHDARVALGKVPQADLSSALQGLTDWAFDNSPKIHGWWGNSAAFDLGILAAAYQHVGVEQPWQFWEERCFRTLKACFNVTKKEVRGVAHSALDDAITQTEILRALYALHDGLKA